MTIREIIEKAEEYVVAIIHGRRHNVWDKWCTAVLFTLSRVYRNVVQLRLTLYSQGIMRQRMLGCLVVSIGNLTVGGTGKTPVVEVFAKTMAAKGRKVAILSRGYRSKGRPFLQKVRNFLFKTNDKIPPRVVSDGKRLLMDSAMAGDEPYMLACNLPDVMVVVDKDRVKAGLYAIRELGADTLVLDDGFQYLRLRPRLNILLVDSTNPFSNHHPLPRGLLREPIKNLRRADYVFLTKSSGRHHIRHLRSFVKRHNPRAEIIECTHQPKYLENVYTRERFDIDFLQGKRVAAVSGIAVPASFEGFLEKLGAELVYCESFMDHHRYRRQEIIDFINQSLNHNAEVIVTTEKDAVRFPRLDRQDINMYFLRVEIDILSGEESFNDCITRICYL